MPARSLGSSPPKLSRLLCGLDMLTDKQKKRMNNVTLTHFLFFFIFEVHNVWEIRSAEKGSMTTDFYFQLIQVLPAICKCCTHYTTGNTEVSWKHNSGFQLFPGLPAIWCEGNLAL